jgi:hypothetical protein
MFELLLSLVVVIYVTIGLLIVKSEDVVFNKNNPF